MGYHQDTRSIESSVAWFASHPHPDIVFLDIQLSGWKFFFIYRTGLSYKSHYLYDRIYDEYAVRPLR